MTDPKTTIMNFMELLVSLQNSINNIDADSDMMTKSISQVPLDKLAKDYSGNYHVNMNSKATWLAATTGGISIIEDECALVKCVTNVPVTNNEDESEVLVEKLNIIGSDGYSSYYSYYLTPDTPRPYIFKLDDYIVSISEITGIALYTNIVYNNLLKMILIENDI